MTGKSLNGPRCVLRPGDGVYPAGLEEVANPPKELYVVGDPHELKPGLAVIGARKSTPYGRTSAQHFARMAAEKGIVIISGGARGCDSEAHRAALDARGKTVVFLGGGCDRIYPAEHRPLFQRIVDAGGAIVSEHPWDFSPLPYTFRARNRLIAGLAQAVLIVEAGLPSGTFSTADEAIDMGREVWAVPGAITSPTSLGSNRLIFQGALPIVDDETFEDALLRVFGALKWPKPAQGDAVPGKGGGEGENDAPTPFVEAVIRAIQAQPLTMDELFALACSFDESDNARAKLLETLVEAEAYGVIARQPDGRWCPRVPLR